MKISIMNNAQVNKFNLRMKKAGIKYKSKNGEKNSQALNCALREINPVINYQHIKNLMK